MPRINRPHETVPDGWFFIEPVTGYRIEGETLDNLVELVCQHRTWKQITPSDPENVRRIIEAQICQAMPEGICRAEEGERYSPFDDKARSLTIESILSASSAAFEFIKSGGELVPKSESERRAGICRGCRFNRPSPCTVCSPIYSMIEALVPASRTEPGVTVCGVCGCALRAKLLLPLQPDGFRYPPHCWTQ